VKLVKAICCALRLSLFAAPFLQPSCALAQTPYLLNAGGFDADAYVSWPVVIAQQKGFFSKGGIQLRAIRTDKAMMGLLAGDLEVANAGVSTALSAGERGANLAIVYVLCDRPAEYMVLRKPLTMLRELEGEVIGVYQVSSTVQLFLKKHLQRNGLDLSTVRFLALGGSRERLASLLAGQSGGTLLSMPYAFRAQQAALKIVASPQDWNKIPWNVIAFRKSWAEANRSTVVKYLHAIQQATAWLYDPSNFNEAVRILTPLSRLDDDTIRWGLRSALDNKVFSSAKPDSGAFQALAGWFAGEGILAKSFNVAPLIDTQYYGLAVAK